MSEDKAFATLTQAIADRGWHGITVPADGQRPSYGYTVGLAENFAHAELLVMGLEPETSRAVLSPLILRIIEGKEDLTRNPDVISNGVTLKLFQVDDAWYEVHAGLAVRYYGGVEFPLMQIVWPDEDGYYPWDEQCDPPVKRSQPPLMLPAQNEH